MSSAGLRRNLLGKTRPVSFTPMNVQKISSSALKSEVEVVNTGLILATCNADGKLYLYDLKNFQNVKRSAQVQVSSDPLSCLSWNKNTFDVDMLLIGSKGSLGTKSVKVAKYDTSLRFLSGTCDLATLNGSRCPTWSSTATVTTVVCMTFPGVL